MRASRNTGSTRPCPALLAASALVLAGCQTGPEASAPSPSAVAPSIHPMDRSFGRIESVRPELALAVLDYSLSTLPEVGDTVTVERGGQEVGRIRVTGPSRAGTGKIAGEIVAGEPRAGDTVRVR